MKETIPCPNPVCMHQFSLAELQAVAQLSCPKCGFRMQGRKPAKPAAPKPVLVAKPAVPVAKPIAPPPPAEDGGLFDPHANSGPLIRTAPRRRFSSTRLLINLFALVFAVSVVVAAVGGLILLFPELKGFLTKEDNSGDVKIYTIRNAKNETERVFKLALSRDDWSRDDDVKRGLGVLAAWKHNSVDFWFALDVQDHGMFKPRDAEMVREGIEKLESLFGNDLELAKMAESAKFGSLPAQRLEFAGVIRNARWRGECQMFFNDGFAYWLIMASPDAGELKRFGTALPEKHVFPLSDRRGWREQAPPVETHVTTNGKLEVTASTKIWQTSAFPKSKDEPGELLLTGIHVGKKDNRKNSHFEILKIEKKATLPEALKSAIAQVEARFKNSDENLKIVEIAPAGPMEIGNRSGQVVELSVRSMEDLRRYLLLAVLQDADTCYVLLGDCDWEFRQIWRQEFLDMLRSLRVK